MAFTTVNSWLNPDGLYRKYGVDEAAAVHGGEFNVEGAIRIMDYDIDLTKLSITAGQNYILSTTATLDNGVTIEGVDIFVRTAASTASSPTFNLGFVQTDYTSTYPGTTPLLGLVSGLTMPGVGTYTSITSGSTGAGTFIGKTLTSNAAVVATASTALYTTGLISVRIRMTVANI